MLSKLTKTFVFVLTILIAFLFVINTFFYYKQSGLIFFPTKRIVETPRDWGLKFEVVKLNLKDKTKISAWHIPHPEATRTVLFFHGNGGNMSHRGHSIHVFHQLKLNILMLDYPGYGESEGTPTEAGLYQSADAAWQYLIETKQLNAKDIIIFGRSLGGAVAVELASRLEAAALILESTFTSVDDMASGVFPLLSDFILLRFSFNSLSKIKRITSPLLVIHSPDDEIIPYALGQKLFHHAETRKEFISISGGHNDGFIKSMPIYQNALRNFISRL